MSAARTAAWVLGCAFGLAAFAGGFVWYRISNPPMQRLTLPPALVSAEADAGRALLAEAESRADYSPLARWYVSQDKLSWCGVASATIVLNALGAHDEPLIQRKLFTREARKVKGRFAVTTGGMTLSELARILAAHGVIAGAVQTDQSDFVSFRTLAAVNLTDASDFVIVNYDRAALGQAGGGHISPLAAWDRETDRFLVMDTAGYRYPPTWVTAADLWAAMDTPDTETGDKRGFVVVRMP